jgi:glycerol-3-phosphate dehydrogenase
MAHATPVQARALVNAAGPWAGAVPAPAANPARHRGAHATLRLVKGSHIVVRRLFEHDHAYIFQNPDKRIIFAIPYEREFTLIGTTDVEHANGRATTRPASMPTRPPTCANRPAATSPRPVTPADVVWRLCRRAPAAGRRIGRRLGRHARLPAGARHGVGTAAPLLSVWGGKITTFRKLAEDAADLVGLVCAARAVLTVRAAQTGSAVANKSPSALNSLRHTLWQHVSP